MSARVSKITTRACRKPFVIALSAGRPGS